MSDQVAMSESEKKKEDWMNAKWRPMMGWMYMVVCTFDFVIFPILWSLVQAMSHGNVSSQWQPVTLQGAGLFHMAMGAVIGVAAFGRTQEKLAGKANDNAVASPAPSFSSPAPSFSSPTPSTPAPSFSSTPAPSFSSTPAPSFGSSKPVAPPPAPQPEL
jgi:Holin of 3TMs, for gene-transfer release